MRRIRWKILLLFFASAGLAITTSLGLAVAAMQLYDRGMLPFSRVFLILEATVGIPAVIGLTAVGLFVLFVILLSFRSIRYLEEIGRSVQKLSAGQLDYRVPVRSQDEMGQLANHINQMAAQLKASIEEERQAVVAKQELITNVSHDLRTPLTSIKGYLQYIHENRYKDEVELMYYADIAYQKSIRLDRMVNDLFEYTRVAYGQTKLKRSQIDIGELLGQLCVELHLMAQEADMELKLNVPEERLVIWADVDKLVRVLENLITNAIQYGKGSRDIRIQLSREQAMAVIRIINYGDPIPAKDLPHIFDRFHRVDKSRSDQSGGTGLGLAIARSIVEMHEGTIEVASDDSETCFTVRLPL